VTSATSFVAPDASGLRSPFINLHHVALVTNDMEKTVAFYRDVLGSEIAMAHRTGEEHVRHYFITVAPNTVFAFFEFPEAVMPELLPATRPKSGRSLDHICLWVEDEAAWDRLHDHLISKGHRCDRGTGAKVAVLPGPEQHRNRSYARQLAAGLSATRRSEPSLRSSHRLARRQAPVPRKATR
jgi:catechol 2,3-dioxygenase-like lactoylglutathione lyase family enzyme